MKNFILAAGVFTFTVAYNRTKNSKRVMTFRELYEDNDVELE